MKIDWIKEFSRIHGVINPTKEQLDLVDENKEDFANFAERVLAQVPDCADKMAACRAIREALHWSNMAIIHSWEK